MSFGTAASSMNEQGGGVAFWFSFALMAASKDGIPVPENVLLSSEAFSISFWRVPSLIWQCVDLCVVSIEK